MQQKTCPCCDEVRHQFDFWSKISKPLILQDFSMNQIFINQFNTRFKPSFIAGSTTPL